MFSMNHALPVSLLRATPQPRRTVDRFVCIYADTGDGLQANFRTRYAVFSRETGFEPPDDYPDGLERDDLRRACPTLPGLGPYEAPLGRRHETDRRGIHAPAFGGHRRRTACRPGGPPAPCGGVLPAVHPPGLSPNRRGDLRRLDTRAQQVRRLRRPDPLEAGGQRGPAAPPPGEPRVASRDRGLLFRS